MWFTSLLFGPYTLCFNMCDLCICVSRSSGGQTNRLQMRKEVEKAWKLTGAMACSARDNKSRQVDEDYFSSQNKVSKIMSCNCWSFFITQLLLFCHLGTGLDTVVVRLFIEQKLQ